MHAVMMDCYTQLESLVTSQYQAHEEGGVSYLRPRNVWGGPAVGQNYKVRQNVPF